MKVREYDPAQQRYVKVPEIPAELVRHPAHHQYFEVLRKAKFYLRIQPHFSPDLDQLFASGDVSGLLALDFEGLEDEFGLHPAMHAAVGPHPRRQMG